MTYVDGLVIPVPTANREKYIEWAKRTVPVFKDYGALGLVECWGNDVPDGDVTSFPKAVQKKDDETVVFCWITWPSKEVRDENAQKAMSVPRLDPEKYPMPFDGRRMIFGGFEMVVDG